MAGNINLALVVDDEPSVGRMVARILEREGISTITTTSPARALKDIRANVSPSYVLITDVNMPEMDGIELAKVARILAPSMPILIMSGLFVPEADSQDLPAGCGFLKKPFTASELLEAIESLC